jgi:hypothetical protein
VSLLPVRAVVTFALMSIAYRPLRSYWKRSLNWSSLSTHNSLEHSSNQRPIPEVYRSEAEPPRVSRHS